ncbi:MAG: hypothetical protein IJP03_03280 [Christensenellaceae bacterium]|nr:hypothetical protein [Christensenellaceae bacterium]
MKVWASIHKDDKVIARAEGESQLDDVSEALLEALEPIYKQLDMSEPVWVGKHARELSRFQRTKFTPADFVEPVDFDFFEIEFSINPD